ncbi:MAG TPA: hypothetical protein VNO55_14160 [Polyangia bacterium]|nr:hypothetical protein [Polyangia bacterium]
MKLLRAVPPLNDAAQRQRRIRLKLGSPSRRGAGFRRRPVMLVLTTMLCVAGASAMVNAGGGWRQARQRIGSWVHREPPAAPRALPARRAIARAVVVPDAAPSPIIAEEVPSPMAPASAERQVRRSENKRRLVDHQPAKVPNRPATEPAPRPADVEADLMLEAIQARQAGDMARAERLLTRYRTEFPDGVLQEEALALSIEAMAVSNRPRAEELARLYLQRYPDGRFRERVARGLRPSSR